MRLSRKRTNRRPGAAMVEAALVMPVFLLFVFGIFEWCRLIYTYQLMTNASREGARFAVVSTNDQTMIADTTNRVRSAMGGADATLNNFTISVYMSDANGTNIGAATNAKFGQYIAVQIDADYVPVLTSPLYVYKQISILVTGSPHLRVRSLMYSEAN